MNCVKHMRQSVESNAARDIQDKDSLGAIPMFLGRKQPFVLAQDISLALSLVQPWDAEPGAESGKWVYDNKPGAL